MEENLLVRRSAELRRSLKEDLRNQRYVGYFSSKCPVCEEPFGAGDGIELHEVFITKGDVMGCSHETRQMINSPFNCVNLHSEKCHLSAQHSSIGKLLCVRQILFFEGVTRVITWLHQFSELLKTNTAENEVRYVIDVLIGNVVIESIPVPNSEPALQDLAKTRFCKWTKENATEPKVTTSLMKKIAM